MIICEETLLFLSVWTSITLFPLSYHGTEPLNHRDASKLRDISVEHPSVSPTFIH